VLQRFRDYRMGEIGLCSVVAAETALWCYGDLRTDLERHGTPIGALDMLIAAHALSLKATLVTNNIKEFERVPGLQLDNWVPSA
jgi:tRNA(fMet)-specific endonuclease VapC